MTGADPFLGEAKMQPNRGVTIPVGVALHWGLEKRTRTTLYFGLDSKGRVLVIPAKDLKSFFRDGD